jgi:hypothetical protein
MARFDKRRVRVTVVLAALLAVLGFAFGFMHAAGW